MTERKTFAPDGLKLSDEGIFEAAFAQFNIVDHDGDVTLPGAFPTKEVPMSAYNHSSWDGAPPVGKGTITERGDWAVFSGEFFMQTTHGRDAYETLKALGPLAEFSYGFSVLDSEPGTHQGKRVRVLKSLDPFEVSQVLKGAGPTTHLMSIKSGGPGPDLPYAEHLSWYADGLTALLDRTKDRAAFREEEGRKLSRTDRTRLAEIEAAWTEHLAVIRELIAVPDDPQKRATSLAIELARARSLGIV